MARYQVRHAYRAERDGDVLGPWQAGENVELEPEAAAWVNADSPGALAEDRPESEPERAKPAGRNRQAKGGANR